jgi:putative ABC transport system ATP-binding protein
MLATTPSASTPVIETLGLFKAYAGGAGDVSVLSGVDLSIAYGEVVALRGPSGSGKSTLLNILGCLDRPSRGKYLLGGSDVSALTREEQAWVRLHYLGFVFQSFHLLSHATALENVALPLHYAGVPRAKSERTARDLLGRVGLGHREDHFPVQLSGGERQRVAIARALTSRPPVLLADEPTGALDTRTGAEIMRLLLELHDEQGTSIILVTHDPTVAGYADRQIFLRDGRVVESMEVPDGARS